MERHLSFILIVVISVTFSPLSAQVDFKAPELLGRPTDNSVMVNVVADAAVEIYAEYGSTAGTYTYQTSTITRAADEPIELIMDGLQATAAIRESPRLDVGASVLCPGPANV